MVEPATVVLRDRRIFVAKANELLGSAVAGAGILTAAAGSFPVRTAADAGIAAASVVAGVLLLGAVAREIREMRSGAPEGGISWVNVFAAAVMCAELVQRYEDRGRIFRPLAVAAALSLVTAFLQPHIQRRQAAQRQVRVDDGGVTVRLGPLRRFHAPWDEIVALRRDGGSLRVELRSGKTRALRLRPFTNRDEAFRVLAAHAAAHGIPASGLHPPLPPAP